MNWLNTFINASLQRGLAITASKLDFSGSHGVPDIAITGTGRSKVVFTYSKNSFPDIPGILMSVRIKSYEVL